MTAAKSDFELRIAQVETLLDELVPGWDPQRDTNAEFETPTPQRVAIACRFALVLLVSYFEGFLKDLVDEGYDTIATSMVASSQLPDRIRGHIVHQHIRTLRNDSSVEKLWIATSAISVLGQELRSDDPVRPELLPRDATRRDVSSIDPDKVNAILKAFGDGDLNRGPMSRFGDQLRSLKRSRDAVVHGNERDVPALGFENVRVARTLLMDAAAALDARVLDLLDGLCGHGV